jgi:hypothetical protein
MSVILKYFEPSSWHEDTITLHRIFNSFCFNDSNIIFAKEVHAKGWPDVLLPESSVFIKEHVDI